MAFSFRGLVKVHSSFSSEVPNLFGLLPPFQEKKWLCVPENLKTKIVPKIIIFPSPWIGPACVCMGGWKGEEDFKESATLFFVFG